MERKNATLNPNAMFQKEVSIEEVLASRMICTPLQMLMVAAMLMGGRSHCL